MNPGGVRADLVHSASTGGEKPGEITYAEAFAVQPFAGSLVSMDLTGAQIEQILEEQFNSTGARAPTLILGVSRGLRYSFSRSAPVGERIDPASIKDGDFPSYLLNVDKPLVLPVGVKVRFVITADDVIHAWWVPSLGWKQDAIPGIINSNWTQIDTPGTYRGQCAELCGKDHGFMPIVVKAVPKAEFEQWMASQQAANAAAQAPATAHVAGMPATQG